MIPAAHVNQTAASFEGRACELAAAWMPDMAAHEVALLTQHPCRTRCEMWRGRTGIWSYCGMCRHKTGGSACLLLCTRTVLMVYICCAASRPHLHRAFSFTA